MFEVPQALLQYVTGISPSVAWDVVAVGYEFGAALLIIALVHFCERQPLASIGVRKMRAADFLIGTAAFIAAVVATAAIWNLLQGSAALGEIINGDDSEVETLLNISFSARIGLAVGTSLAEEFGARGYAIERLTTLTGSVAIGATLAFLGALAMHVPHRGLLALPLLAPGQLILVLVYVWRRSVGTCVIAHILTDGYSMVVFWLLPSAARNYLWQLGL